MLSWHSFGSLSTGILAYYLSCTDSVNDVGQVEQSSLSKPTVEPESCLEGKLET